jgi:outer membrane protein assembly factor BamB
MLACAQAPQRFAKKNGLKGSDGDVVIDQFNACAFVMCLFDPVPRLQKIVAKGMKDTDSKDYGGPIVAAGSLVVIAGTIYERKIRAFDTKSGKLLWEADLPYAGNATPATYMVDGKQYVVIATSRARDSKGAQGAAYVAFATATDSIL